MPTRYKSELPPPTPMFEKDKEVGDWIELVLTKYPQHKRVLFLKSKYDNNEKLTVTEKSELRKFREIASKK